jgi:hypothetical protein
LLNGGLSLTLLNQATSLLDGRRETMAKKVYKSPALRSLHEAMVDLHAVGAIDDDKKAEFDKSCLRKPTPKKRAHKPRA